ncbi:hypothetical protein AB7M63_006503 [Bradyrhizobium japonicum]
MRGARMTRVAKERARMDEPADKPGLDLRRIEVMLFHYDASHLETPDDLRRFVSSLHSVSDGASEALSLLTRAFKEWPPFDKPSAILKLETLWEEYDFEEPVRVSAAMTVLWRYLISQSFPLEDGLTRAIFVEPWTDFSGKYREHCQDYSLSYRDTSGV